ncbi:metallophosphoesterase [Thalassobacillus hwangdonensis]|uniref:Metallophosphoesterase n=1 Tax=Thalassobacillus hwangdonensis TaxID=546108 RepID=A0ABW3KVS0_9BACI
MRITRRTFLKKALTSVFAIFGLSSGGYYYARYIETDMLDVKKETIASQTIPSSFQDFKILLFSDTHLGFNYDLNQFEKLVNSINKESPDLIVFAGDLVDQPNAYSWNNRLEGLLSKLNAPYGKFWIYGNHDHGGYGTDIVDQTMKKGGFQLLRNQHTIVNQGEASIAMAGLDDVMLGKPNLHRTLDGVPEDLFTILLCHEPDFADEASRYQVDLQLSGHSHGGQIRLPIVGDLITPPLAKKYVEGWHDVGSDSMKLYVTRGIGTTRMPYRFLCKPEITLFRLSQPS